jgi:hypothetical protein
MAKQVKKSTWSRRSIAVEVPRRLGKGDNMVGEGKLQNTVNTRGVEAESMQHGISA